MMLNFFDFLLEEKAKPEDFGNLSKNDKGVLHEILVGYHLLGGKHMKKHVDINGDSPEEVHDRLKKLLTDKQYQNFSTRALKAANDILKEKKMSREDLANVQWTSKAGDIKRATGIDSSQKEDDSDIIMTHKDGTHHGLSLKVSDDSKPITLSNNGAESSFGGKEIFANHIEQLKKDYPVIADVKKDPEVLEAARKRVIAKAAARGVSLSPEDAKIDASEARKAWLESNPKAKEDIKKRTTAMLNSVVENMHNELQKLPPQELADHLRNSVLHAYKTPKEKLEAGHTHMRHFTGGGHDPVFENKKPGEDYEHFLSKPENIRVTRKGSTITYHHHDDETGKLIPFAMQTAKVGSQSDPTSSIVLIGKDVERKQDILDKERIKNNFKKQTPAPALSNKPKFAAKPVAAAAEPESKHQIVAASTHGGVSYHSPDEQQHILGLA